MFQRLFPSLPRYLISISFGLFIVSAIFSLMFGPMVNSLIKWELKLNKENKEAFKGWQKTPIPIYMSFYFFNITNPEDVLLGKSYNLEELGPYVFIENREKVNITINNEKGTISYMEKKVWHFDPTRTKGNLSDVISHLNIPLVSLGDSAHKSGDVMYGYLQEMVALENITLFSKHSVNELLFEGYEDPIIDGAVGMGVPVKPKFGFFYGKNGSISKEIVVENGELDINRLGKIYSYDHKNSLNFWKSDSCNQLNTSIRGDLNAPLLKTPPARINIFNEELCRSLPLNYVGEHKANLRTNRYALSPEVFDYNLPENQCFCLDNNTCPANGIYMNSPCVEGAPSAISFPHFLYADKSYLKGLRGLRPGVEKHQFYLDIEPVLGVVQKAVVRLQVNFLLRKDEQIEYTHFMKKREQIVPVFWFSTEATLEGEMLEKIILIQNGLPLAIEFLPFVLLTLGLVLIFVGFMFCSVRQKQQTPEDVKVNRRVYSKVETTSFNQ